MDRGLYLVSGEEGEVGVLGGKVRRADIDSGVRVELCNALAAGLGAEFGEGGREDGGEC